MRKVLIILLTIGVIFTSGCTKSNEFPNSVKQSSDISNSKPSSQADSVSTKTETKDDLNIETVDNPYFFKSNISQLNYNGKFLFDDIMDQDINLNINELANFKNGKLYELKIDAIEGVPDNRLNLGYFYVQKDKIYKIESTEENIDKLKTSEELLNDSVIVSQDKEIKDVLGKDEQGFHHYLEINEDKQEYHSYNNQVDTGYYESFIWEKDKGLVNYRSGYGAERDSIELQLIND